MINQLLIVILTIHGAHSVLFEKVAEPGEFKYMVSIWYLDEYQCSGAIIDRIHILTTATCLNGHSSTDLTVIAGTTQTHLPSRQILQVKSIHFHHGLKPSSSGVDSNDVRWENDIVILRLVYDIIWDKLIGPIKLIIPQDHRSTFSECVMSGWSPERKLDDAYQSLRLKWVKTTILSELECRLTVPYLLKNENCADTTATNIIRLTKNIGSPIICDDVAIGIVKEISKNRHIFLDIFPYLDFIADIVDDTKNDAILGEFPYVVSIWNGDTLLCGGTIVDDIHIITIAHCFRQVNISNVRVNVGNTQGLAGSVLLEWLTVDNILLNPKPAGFAILELTEHLEFNWFIAPASFPNAINVPDMQYGKVIRWHPAYAVEDKTLMKLVWSSELILDFESCRQLEMNLEENQFCATRGNFYQNSTIGNFGSFILSEGFVVGVGVPGDSESPLSTCYTPFRKIVREIDEASK